MKSFEEDPERRKKLVEEIEQVLDKYEADPDIAAEYLVRCLEAWENALHEWCEDNEVRCGAWGEEI